MNVVTVDQRFLKIFRSLIAKASIEELYLLHGMLLFQSAIYSATGSSSMRLTITHAESHLIDRVSSLGGYPEDIRDRD